MTEFAETPFIISYECESGTVIEGEQIRSMSIVNLCPNGECLGEVPFTVHFGTEYVSIKWGDDDTMMHLTWMEFARRLYTK